MCQSCKTNKVRQNLSLYSPELPLLYYIFQYSPQTFAVTPCSFNSHKVFPSYEETNTICIYNVQYTDPLAVSIPVMHEKIGNDAGNLGMHALHLKKKATPRIKKRQ